MIDEATKLVRRADAARNVPSNTCGASRHVEEMARALMAGRDYSMLATEPEYCGESMLATVVALYEARTEIAALRETLANVGGERDSLQLRVQQLDADEDRLDW